MHADDYLNDPETLKKLVRLQPLLLRLLRTCPPFAPPPGLTEDVVGTRVLQGLHPLACALCLAAGCGILQQQGACGAGRQAGPRLAGVRCAPGSPRFF